MCVSSVRRFKMLLCDLLLICAVEPYVLEQY